MPDSDEFDRGRLWERTDNLASQLRGHVDLTDRRFIRLEEKIDEGFAASQTDREAGNRTLGNLIAQLRDDMSKNKGGITVAAFVISNLVVLVAALLGAKLLFH